MPITLSGTLYRGLVAVILLTGVAGIVLAQTPDSKPPATRIDFRHTPRRSRGHSSSTATPPTLFMT
jgi:hypothetical protein